MIELSGVDSVKSGQKIFQDFNWKINDGEHWVITGPNGCGKTSLLEVLSGHQTVQHGSVGYDFITGSTWDERFEQKRRLIQYIPAQAAHVLVPATGDLYYQQRYYSIGDEIHVTKVRDFLRGDLHHFQTKDLPATFNLEPLLDREIKWLSNGQLKKVLILQRLLHHLPKLLLLDYPFEGLDRDSRADLCEFIDFIAATYSIQIIIAGHGSELPRCMTHRLTMDSLQIKKAEVIGHEELEMRTQVVSQRSNGTQAADVVVDIRDLKIRYGNTVILENFNWTINRGDRWALTGSNGSGKTTVFSIIFADHPMAYSQEVYLFGKRRGTGESIWDIKKRINYLGPELISYLDTQTAASTAREYIRGRNDRDDARLEELTRFFVAGSFIDKPLRHLSSGQLQLTLLMSCFMDTKELLLLDEPFQFLSPEIRELVSDYLQGYVHKDITLVLITHYDQDLVRWTEKTMRV
ncbi:MAG TPA: ATP-binding cassette domain-containing protein [Cyclobacteriaceae bacterium]|nr:ATP-binding cassette domain-containing protein [Cyclobacteriaceae bacterium]